MSNRPRLQLLSNLPGSSPNSSTDTNNDERLSDMDDNEYVTHRDLSHLEEKTNLKLENLKTEIKSEISNLDTKIDGKFNTLDEKFTTLDQRLESMFLQQKIDIANERKENIKWIIGTGLAVIGTIAAILALIP